MGARAALGLSWKPPAEVIDRDIALLSSETVQSIAQRLTGIFAKDNVVVIAKLPGSTHTPEGEIATNFRAHKNTPLEFESAAPFYYDTFGPSENATVNTTGGRFFVAFPNGIKARVERPDTGDTFTLNAKIGRGILDLAPGEAGCVMPLSAPPV
jgi:hypothetical protein